MYTIMAIDADATCMLSIMPRMQVWMAGERFGASAVTRRIVIDALIWGIFPQAPPDAA